MASQFTPQEIADIKSRWADRVYLSTEELADLEKEYKDLQVGIKGYTKELENARRDFKASMSDLVKNMIGGTSGLSQYNDAISASTKGLSTLAEAIPGVGKALSLTIKAVGWYSKQVTEQADNLSKTYKDISQVGLTGSAGMQGVFDSAQKFGYTVKEMGEFGTLLKSNSKELAQLGGTALAGTETFSEMSKSITRSDFGSRMQNMGMSIDNMNKGAANYLKLQVQQGRAREMTQEQLTAGAAEYIEQQDKLAKLTGLNAEAQYNIREAARKDEKFGAYLRQTERSGTEEEKKKAKMYEELNVTMAETAPTYAKGMRDIIAGGGAITSTEASQFAMTAPKTMAMIKEGKASAAEVRQAMSKELKERQKFIDEQAQRGIGGETFGPAYERAMLQQQGETMAESEKTAKDQQNVTDKLTQSTVKLENAQRNVTQKLDTGFNKGIGAVTKVFETIAKGVNIGATAAGGAVGVKPAGGGQIGGGGSGAAAPAAGPGIKDTSGAPGKAEDLLTFGSGTGSKANFDGLSDRMKNAVLKAAEQYKSATGKTLKINSANRTFEEQQRLYNELAPKGKPVAKPGKSNHEQGNAVDIQNYSDPLAVSAMRSQGLTNSIKGDPQHFSGSGFANGGIASGPKSGYSTTLHGTEAIVPLPNGNSIPVEMPMGNNSTDEQNEILEEQINKMSDLMKIMESQLSISSKILQMTQ